MLLQLIELLSQVSIVDNTVEIFADNGQLIPGFFRRRDRLFCLLVGLDILKNYNLERSFGTSSVFDRFWLHLFNCCPHSAAEIVKCVHVDGNFLFQLHQMQQCGGELFQGLCLKQIHDICQQRMHFPQETWRQRRIFKGLQHLDRHLL